MTQLINPGVEKKPVFASVDELTRATVTIDMLNGGYAPLQEGKPQLHYWRHVAIGNITYLADYFKERDGTFQFFQARPI